MSLEWDKTNKHTWNKVTWIGRLSWGFIVKNFIIAIIVVFALVTVVTESHKYWWGAISGNEITTEMRATVGMILPWEEGLPRDQGYSIAYPKQAEVCCVQTAYHIAFRVHYPRKMIPILNWNTHISPQCYCMGTSHLMTQQLVNEGRFASIGSTNHSCPDNPLVSWFHPCPSLIHHLVPCFISRTPMG